MLWLHNRIWGLNLGERGGTDHLGLFSPPLLRLREEVVAWENVCLWVSSTLVSFSTTGVHREVMVTLVLFSVTCFLGVLGVKEILEKRNQSPSGSHEE